MNKNADLKWILVVEDEPDIMESLCLGLSLCLTSFKPIFVKAPDGRAALYKLGEREFDCIVTDLKMPHMTGEEFIAKCHTNSLNANTPIIVHSAFSKPEVIDKYAHINYAEKPFPLPALASMISSEIKKGKTDLRIATHIIYPAITSSIQALEGLSLTPKQGEPEPKNSGRDLRGDYVCSAKIRTEASKSRVNFGISESLAIKIRNIMNGSGFGLDTENAVKKFSQLVLENLSIEVENLSGKRTKLVSLQVYSRKAEAYAGATPHAKYFDPATGLTIPLSCDEGNFYVNAIEGVQ